MSSVCTIWICMIIIIISATSVTSITISISTVISVFLNVWSIMTLLGLLHKTCFKKSWTELDDFDKPIQTVCLSLFYSGKFSVRRTCNFQASTQKTDWGALCVKTARIYLQNIIDFRIISVEPLIDSLISATASRHRSGRQDFRG